MCRTPISIRSGFSESQRYQYIIGEQTNNTKPSCAHLRMFFSIHCPQSNYWYGTNQFHNQFYSSLENLTNRVLHPYLLKSTQ